jgi:hypothetical protein
MKRSIQRLEEQMAQIFNTIYKRKRSSVQKVYPSD